MGGLYGSVSTDDCVQDVFYGTDYHSHLGTRRGGMAVANGSGYDRVIHDITTSQFRPRFRVRERFVGVVQALEKDS